MSADFNRQVCLWNVKTGELVRQFDLGDTTGPVAFSANGKWLATSDEEGNVVLVQLSDGASHTLYQGHAADVCSIAFSPNSDRIISGSFDGSARIWRVPQP